MSEKICEACGSRVSSCGHFWGTLWSHEPNDRKCLEMQLAQLRAERDRLRAERDRLCEYIMSRAHTTPDPFAEHTRMWADEFTGDCDHTKDD